MEVHRQTCQQCGSINVRNILVRDQDESISVYVRCSNCLELVAAYALRDYYHHHRGYESFLRSHGSSSSESGREWLSQFKKAEQDALTGFAAALKSLEEQRKEV